MPKGQRMRILSSTCWGVAWITAIFPWYIEGVKYFVFGSETGNVGPQVTAAIAATHTGFNVANTLLFLPFTAVLANILMRIVPEKKFRNHRG